MPRVRLTDEEREARRKERNAFTFSDDAYKHYDVDELGYGSFTQWEQTAEALFGRAPAAGGIGNITHALRVLGLKVKPNNITELKTMFRRVLHRVHPDHGGSNDATREAMAAYVFLKRHLT